jgi:hypothetical protein
MGKYIQLSRCYLDDRDMSDILSNGQFNTRFLLQFARNRGVFISNKDPHANIIKYLSRQGYSWQELLRIAEKLNSEDREERQSTRRVEGVKDSEQIEKVLGEVKEARVSDKQICAVKKKGNIYEMEVTHVEIDTTKQKAFQRRQLTSKLEFEQIGDRLDVRHHQNDTCKAIANQVIELLQKHTKSDLKSTSIELTGIRDPVKRTAFFLSLTHKVKEFRHIDVIDLKVSNRFPEVAPATKNVPSATDDNEENESKEETQEEAEIKSLVKHAALSGQGLLTSELYKKLRETGYYLSNVIWSAKELKGEERLVEFVSGFGKPVEALDFYYDVRKIYPRDDEADQTKTQGELLSLDRTRLRRLLEIAAYESLAELQKPDDAKEKK